MDSTFRLSVLDQTPVPAGQTAGRALANSIDLARRADQLGYHRYWVAEHHATGAFAGSAPEILIARLAAETERLRVGSGGVMLPHYSAFKVAEVFSTLEALYPGRVDLGVGRAPGGSPLESHALRRERRQGLPPDDFPEQLAELLAFLERALPASHPFARIELSPAPQAPPPVWLLGSSMWSASAAAQFGLPYAFAHFIDPNPTRRAIEHYFAHFEPARAGDGPRAICAVGAVCADTEQEANQLAQSLRYLRQQLTTTGKIGPILDPDEAASRLASFAGVRSAATAAEHSEWPRVLVGAPEQIRARVDAMRRELRVDEVMVVTIVHDHGARLRSYELLAEAFELDRRPAREEAETAGASIA